LAQRLSELTGVGKVTVQGGIRPAVRIQVDLARLANYGIGLEDIRNVIVAANVAGPKGSLDGAHQSYTISSNDQILAADAYENVVITYRNGGPVLLRDVAEIIDGLENNKVAGWYQGNPAIVVDIQRQPCSASSASCRGCSAPSRPARRSPWCTTPPPPYERRSATCSSRWC
jgi:multidrug efflux pump